MLFEHSIRCVIITMFISSQYKAITDAASDDIGALLREAVGRGFNTYAQSEANESGGPAHSVRRRRYYGVCTVNCNHGSCNENTMQCVCHPGWGGEYCTKRVCDVNCNNGFCNENTNRCVCNSGWGGEYCTKQLCTVNCNHGSCNENTKRCVCHRGWGGEYCTKKVCTVNCNHGSCNENTNRCVCHRGWGGEYCTKKRNSGSVPAPTEVCTVNCNHGSCNENTNRCVCHPGWGGEYCTKTRNPGSAPALYCKPKCSKKTAGHIMEYCTGRPPMVQKICLNPGETETIQSPNYPNRYNSKTWCKWRVRSCKDITITCSEDVLQSSNGKCAKKQYLRYEGSNCKSCVGDKNILIVLKGHRKRTFKAFRCTLRAAN